jgi:hypothetical protein
MKIYKKARQKYYKGKSPLHETVAFASKKGVSGSARARGIICREILDKN